MVGENGWMDLPVCNCEEAQTFGGGRPVSAQPKRSRDKLDAIASKPLEFRRMGATCRHSRCQ